MKKHLLTLLLCAFGLSLSPLASAAPEIVTAEEALPFFKKKNSMARYKQIKRKNGTYVKKRTSKKKSLF